MHDPLTKAAVADRRQSDLFTTPAVIAGHMRGPVYVAPYTALRRRRAEAPALPPGRIITTTEADRLLPSSFAAAAEEMRQRLMPHHVIRLDAKDSAHHPSGFISATRSDLEYGQDNDIPPYGNGTHDFTITINVANETGRLRPAADVVHTLLHEFGHAFQFARFHGAPAATQEAIRAQWADETRRANDPDAGRDLADAASVRRWVSRGITEAEMRPTLDVNLKHTAPYYRRFEEWFAEKFAAWMTHRETDTPIMRLFEAGRLALMEAWRRALAILGMRDLTPTSAGGAFERFLDDTWTTGDRPMRKAIIFLKARIPGGAMGDLFAQPVQVAGHTRKDGTFVAPHQSTRLKAPVAPPPAPERGADLGGKRPTYPDGRLIPRDGDEVFQTVPGPFGMAATLTGVVRGKRVHITGAHSMIAGRASRKTDSLTEHWTVKGDPELARRRAEREAKEAAAKAAAEAERAAEEARLQALAENRGTLDPATVQIGDVIESPEGVPYLVAEKHGTDIYGHPVGDKDTHRGGLGGDWRGWRKTSLTAPEGSIIVHYDPPDSLAASAMRVRRRQGNAWVPVEWSDEADDYVPIAPPPAATPPAPPAIRAPEGNREKLLLWAVSRGDRDQAARMSAGDMLAAIANRRFDLAQRAMLTGDQPEANAIMNLAVEGANAEGALANHLDDTRGQAAFDFLAEAMGGTLAETFQAQTRATRPAKKPPAKPMTLAEMTTQEYRLRRDIEKLTTGMLPAPGSPEDVKRRRRLETLQARHRDLKATLDAALAKAPPPKAIAIIGARPVPPAADAEGRHRAFVAKMKGAGITAPDLADFMGESRSRVARRLKDRIPPTPGEVAALDAMIAQGAKTAAARLPPPGPPGSIFPAVHQARLRDLYREAVYGAGAEPRRAARQRIEALLTETGVTLKEAFERSGLDLAAYFASRPIG